ncbi:EthD domain-containing protein [Penicillium malachiteum]|uniref:EthD domain-containing protein n=1 Tax=Penicillium malachiteum TaxID=1324776 RepID=UPI002549A091|nr:EthD domain-containing protein [Penicillium malachiteum]KAJ5726152.1 EthD domain-containing protein [Penicillium malachiteum]
MASQENPASAPTLEKLLCLTICGYRKAGMSEEDYRHHMTQISAPMSKDLMVKYGIVRWTQIHNTSATRALMGEIFDPQFANVTDYDCFSQAVFRDIEDYKRMKQDPWYKEHLVGDHENFADTKRSQYV